MNFVICETHGTLQTFDDLEVRHGAYIYCPHCGKETCEVEQ